MEWTSTKDRLPPDGSALLLATEGGVVQGYYTGTKFRDDYCCDGPACYGGIGTVTHWMPLPPLPSEGS